MRSDDSYSGSDSTDGINSSSVNSNKERHYVSSSALAFIISPFVASVGFFVGLAFVGSSIAGLAISFLPPTSGSSVNTIAVVISAIIALVPLVFLWLPNIRNVLKRDGEKSASKLLLPILAAFIYYMGLWVILFGFYGYSFSGTDDSFLLFGLGFPYIVLSFIFLLVGSINSLPLVFAIVTAASVMSVLITLWIKKAKIRLDKKVLVCIAISVALSGVAMFQFYDRSNIFLVDRYGNTAGSDGIITYHYMPFTEKNRLEKLDESATISIDSNYPRLDGATAALPVYGAMAQEIYVGLDGKTVDEYVFCSRTDKAYERLINGEIDIFLGAEPSEEQKQLAKNHGVELVLTPVANEAFVIITNENNPIDSLTVEQLQDVYQGKITNWSELGGKNEGIIAFQRPENSGSQTVMLSAVMQGKPMMEPDVNVMPGMGGMISNVVEYRNYSTAIGYSFRYYTTSMNPSAKIKILAVDGIDPTVENIQKGTYPFTIETYAITTRSIDDHSNPTDSGATSNGAASSASNNDTGHDDNGTDGSAVTDNNAEATGATSNEARQENVQKLISWMLSSQGQGFIEKCGYVPIQSISN